MIKKVVVNYRRPGMSVEDFSTHWRTIHARLVEKHAAALGIVRYVQSHRIEDETITAQAQERGWSSPIDGVTEVWYADQDTMRAAYASEAGQAAQAELKADESNFVDPTRMMVVLTSEVTVIDAALP